MAVRDLIETFPAGYPDGDESLNAVTRFERRLSEIREGLRRRNRAAIEEARRIVVLERRALLANPLLDFDRLLLIRRKPLDDPRRATGDEINDNSLGRYLGLPRQSSWHLHTMKNTDGWDNEIAVLSVRRPASKLTTFYRPPDGRLVNEMDLHFDAGKLLFSMPDDGKLWQVFEIDLGTGELRQDIQVGTGS